MKKLLVMGLSCSIFAAQGMSEQENLKKDADHAELVATQEEQGLFSRMRVEHEISQARFSEKMTDVTGPLSDEEYNQVELTYRVFVGENRVRLVSKKDASEKSGKTVLPDCTINRLIWFFKDATGVTFLNNRYRILKHDTWKNGCKPTRQQLLEGVADIMSMNDRFSVLTQKLDGTNEVQIHFIDIIDHAHNQKQVGVIGQSLEILEKQKNYQEAREKAWLMGQLSRMGVVLCMLVGGGYYSYKNSALIKERVLKLYRCLTSKKKRIVKKQKEGSHYRC